MQARSASAAPGVAADCLSTVTDSPVRPDSSISSPSTASSRASAGTTSPVRRAMTSPGRSAVAGTRVPARPSSSWARLRARGPARRRAVVCSPTNSWCSAASARWRCRADINALTPITELTNAASVGEPMIAEAAAPTLRTGVRGSPSSSRTCRDSRSAALAGRRTGAARGRSASWCTPWSTASASSRGQARRGGVGRCVFRGAAGSRASASSASKACQGTSGTASLPLSRPARHPDRTPEVIPANAAAVTGLVARTRAPRRGPATSSRPPSVLADSARVRPRSLTRRAGAVAASSCSTGRRSSQMRSALHGTWTAPSARRLVRPIATSAAARARWLSRLTRATTCPCSCKRRTRAVVDPPEATNSSARGRRSVVLASPTSTTRSSDRRAAASTLSARGCSSLPTSARPSATPFSRSSRHDGSPGRASRWWRRRAAVRVNRLPARPRGGGMGRLAGCRPCPSVHKRRWAALHTCSVLQPGPCACASSTNARSPRTAWLSTMTAETRSRRRHIEVSRDNTPRRDITVDSVLAKDSRLVRDARGTPTSTAAGASASRRWPARVANDAASDPAAAWSAKRSIGPGGSGHGRGGTTSGSSTAAVVAPAGP